MKYLYQELQQLEADLSSAFEDGELQAELDKITENIWFVDIIKVCQEIVYLKEELINLGYEL